MVFRLPTSVFGLPTSSSNPLPPEHQKPPNPTKGNFSANQNWSRHFKRIVIFQLRSSVFVFRLPTSPFTTKAPKAPNPTKGNIPANQNWSRHCKRIVIFQLRSSDFRLRSSLFRLPTSPFTTKAPKAPNPTKGNLPANQNRLLLPSC